MSSSSASGAEPVIGSSWFSGTFVGMAETVVPSAVTETNPDSVSWALLAPSSSATDFASDSSRGEDFAGSVRSLWEAVMATSAPAHWERT